MQVGSFQLDFKEPFIILKKSLHREIVDQYSADLVRFSIKKKIIGALIYLHSSDDLLMT